MISFFYKTNHRFDYFREIFYKLFIKIIKVDKNSYLLQIYKLCLIDDDLYLN